MVEMLAPRTCSRDLTVQDLTRVAPMAAGPMVVAFWAMVADLMGVAQTAAIPMSQDRMVVLVPTVVRRTVVPHTLFLLTVVVAHMAPLLHMANRTQPMVILTKSMDRLYRREFHMAEHTDMQGQPTGQHMVRTPMATMREARTRTKGTVLHVDARDHMARYD